MAFYIKSNDPEMNQNTYYSEDGSTIYTTSTSAKGYSTEAAAQAVIDANPTWIATAKSNGETFSVEQFAD